VAAARIGLCVLNVVQLLVIDQHVCIIDSHRKLSFLTANELIGENNIQWIVQSDAESFPPWFEAGLTGGRQFIGLSDTVSSRNFEVNCVSVTYYELNRTRFDSPIVLSFHIFRELIPTIVTLILVMVLMLSRTG